MRRLIAIALLALSAAAATAQSRVPTTAEIAAVEQATALPASARPLGDYVRYYAFRPVPVGGRQHIMIAGVLVAPGLEMGQWNRRRGAYGVATLPQPKLLDGGCAVIHVFYDLQARRMINAFCNGDA